MKWQTRRGLAAGLWLSLVTQAPSLSQLGVPCNENAEDTFNICQTHFSSIYMTHLESLSSQTWCHFLSWTFVLITVTNEQYWCIYCCFEWICTLCRQRKAPASSMQMTASAMLRWWQCGKQRGFHMWCHHCSQSTSHQRSMCTLYEIYSSYMEGSWALEQQCEEPRCPVLGYFKRIFFNVVTSSFHVQIKGFHKTSEFLQPN